MKKKQFWTLRYILLNVTYFAAFCTIHACAALYLLEQGFSNVEVGVLLAVANIVSAIVQPIAADIIDKPGWLTNRRFILICVAIIGIGSLLLVFLHSSKIAVFIIYALIYMIQFAYQPVMTALCFEYQKAGADIMYGLARGLGSASFAITSAIIGKAVENYGVGLLLTVNIVTMILSALLIFFFRKPEENTEKQSEEKKTAAGKTGVSAFIKKYPAYMLYLVGTICFFFAHNMINDFMIQIIRNLGGGEAQLGYANFLQAILELPVMALIGIVLKKFAPKTLMVFSGAAFFVKIVILLFATNMATMYISQSFQLFAYAVFIPAAAYYVSNTMEEADQVKGQAFITSAITMGGVFSNLLSGVILDHLGMRSMLLTGSGVCAVGVVIAFVAMAKLPHYRKQNVG
ncbi:MAG: MFS transporter [Lachnospiraceae bacterium]|nr:MFS transporter [Lachnospiraceae bacterium]